MNKNQRKLVKRGSLWRKRDQGIVIEVVALCPKDTAKTRRYNTANVKGKTHVIKLHDLLKFYDKL